MPLGGSFVGGTLGLNPKVIYTAPSDIEGTYIILRAVFNLLGEDDTQFSVSHRSGGTLTPLVLGQDLFADSVYPDRVRKPESPKLGGTVLAPGDALVASARITESENPSNPVATLPALYAGQHWLTWVTALADPAFSAQNRFCSFALSTFGIES